MLLLKSSPAMYFPYIQLLILSTEQILKNLY
jgi:hypothetical protein